MLAEGQNRALCEEMIFSLDVAWASRPACALDLEAQKKIALFTNLFLFIMAYPTFMIPDGFSDKFVKRNHLISNLVNLSAFKTTDAHLEIIRTQPHNYIKILALYSARNVTQFDRSEIFKVNALLASIWYMQYAESFHAGLVDAQVYENLREHFMFSTPALIAISNLQEPYFGSSYIDAPCERTIKYAVNQSVRRGYASMQIPSSPRNVRKIAVATSFWWPTHSACRICSALIEALKPKYHLTFVRLGKATQEPTGFDEEVVVNSEQGIADARPLVNNDFQMMLYLDIGMSPESIVLANIRLAPIQACMLGHSVSTFGAQIDYFFSGAGVETADAPEKNYSERLVLLPGMGAIHLPPAYQLRGVAKRTDRIMINCPWQTHKINHPLLLTLGRLVKSCAREVCFRIFIGDGTSTYNDYPAFYADIKSHLGTGNFELITDTPYDNYMALLEQGHLSLDAWHFGGCNTVSDSLFLRIPMVCRQGERWYNRIGPYMLRRAGLPELVADSDERFVAIAHRLIHEDAWREGLTRRLRSADLEGTIYAQHDAPHFAAAIDYLIENHEQLKSGSDKSPLRFPRV